MFWSEQATRLRQVAERTGMAKAHQDERRELSQAHDRTRSYRLDNHVKALDRSRQIPIERLIRQDNVRPAPAFEQAAGRSHELKR